MRGSLFPPRIRMTEGNLRGRWLYVAVLLAGEVALYAHRPVLQHDSQQESRVRWIERLLGAAFMTPERVYQPILEYALQDGGGRNPSTETTNRRDGR